MFVITMVCAGIERLGLGEWALHSSLKDLNFEPALFTYPSSLCYPDKLHLSVSVQQEWQWSFLAGISAFKRLWCCNGVWS